MLYRMGATARVTLNHSRRGVYNVYILCFCRLVDAKNGSNRLQVYKQRLVDL